MIKDIKRILLRKKSPPRFHAPPLPTDLFSQPGESILLALLKLKRPGPEPAIDIRRLVAQHRLVGALLVHGRQVVGRVLQRRDDAPPRHVVEQLRVDAPAPQAVRDAPAQDRDVVRVVALPRRLRARQLRQQPVCRRARHRVRERAQREARPVHQPRPLRHAEVAQQRRRPRVQVVPVRERGVPEQRVHRPPQVLRRHVALLEAHVHAVEVVPAVAQVEEIPRPRVAEGIALGGGVGGRRGVVPDRALDQRDLARPQPDVPVDVVLEDESRLDARVQERPQDVQVSQPGEQGAPLHHRVLLRPEPVLVLLGPGRLGGDGEIQLRDIGGVDERVSSRRGLRRHHEYATESQGGVRGGDRLVGSEEAGCRRPAGKIGNQHRWLEPVQHGEEQPDGERTVAQWPPGSRE